MTRRPDMPAPAAARPAASVVVVRDGVHGTLEVLLGRRTPGARFLPNAWVFPGGAVDGGADDAVALRDTAVRELAEEVGLELPPDAELIPFDRLVTPLWAPIRFDTAFFLVPAPSPSDPRPDGAEIVEIAWITPAEALRRGAERSMLLMPPTLLQLRELDGLETAAAAVAACRGRAAAPRTVNVPPPGPWRPSR